MVMISLLYTLIPYIVNNFSSHLYENNFNGGEQLEMENSNKRKLSLSAWIFIGMIAGIIAGLLFLGNPDFTTNYIKPFGTIYINLLKFLVVPVVLFSIIGGVISLQDLKRVGSIGWKTFVYYMLTTAAAVVIGLTFANVCKGRFPMLETADASY